MQCRSVSGDGCMPNIVCSTGFLSVVGSVHNKPWVSPNHLILMGHEYEIIIDKELYSLIGQIEQGLTITYAIIYIFVHFSNICFELVSFSQLHTKSLWIF